MAQATKAASRGFNRAAAPLVLKPETRFRLSHLLSVRTSISVRDAAPLASARGMDRTEPMLLQLRSAILDLYPFGSGLRFSAGVGPDEAGDEVPVMERSRDAEMQPSVATAPAFAVGYGGSVMGPLNFAVEGGVKLHEMPRQGQAVPRLTGNSGVDRAYPVVRFSLSRAF